MAGRYEIPDNGWALIEDIVSPPKTMGRPRLDDRQVSNGIFWTLCSGAKWRDLPELLKLLNLQGCLVTIDAMGCQKKITTQVLNQGADYLLSVKDNQPALADAFEEAFTMAKVANFDGDAYVTDEKSRGLKG